MDDTEILITYQGKTTEVDITVAAIVETYTVTFESNGGSAVAPVTEIEEGATVTLPAAPTKDGYVFEGWFTIM